MKTQLACLLITAGLSLSSCDSEKEDFSITNDFPLSDAKILVVTPDNNFVLSKITSVDSLKKIELKKESGENILHQNITMMSPELLSLPNGAIGMQSYRSIFNERISDTKSIIIYPKENIFSSLNTDYLICSRFMNNEISSFNNEIYATKEVYGVFYNENDPSYNGDGYGNIVYKVNFSNPENITYTETNNSLTSAEFEVDKDGHIFTGINSSIYYGYDDVYYKEATKDLKSGNMIYPLPDTAKYTTLYWKNKNKEIYCLNVVNDTIKFGQAIYSNGTFEYNYTGFSIDNDYIYDYKGITSSNAYKFDIGDKTYFIRYNGEIYVADYTKKTFNYVTRHYGENLKVAASQKYLYLYEYETISRLNPANNEISTVYVYISHSFNNLLIDESENIYFGALNNLTSKMEIGKITSSNTLKVLKEDINSYESNLIAY